MNNKEMKYKIGRTSDHLRNPATAKAYTKSLKGGGFSWWWGIFAGLLIYFVLGLV